MEYSVHTFTMVVCFPVDVTTNFRGYNGDLNETLFVGNVDDKSKDLVRVTHECLSQAIEMGELATLEKLVKSCGRDIVCVIGEYIANCTMLCTCVLPLYFSKAWSIVQRSGECDSASRTEERLICRTLLLWTWHSSVRKNVDEKTWSEITLLHELRDRKLNIKSGVIILHFATVVLLVFCIFS